METISFEEFKKSSLTTLDIAHKLFVGTFGQILVSPDIQENKLIGLHIMEGKNVLARILGIENIRELQEALEQAIKFYERGEWTILPQEIRDRYKED